MDWNPFRRRSDPERVPRPSSENRPQAPDDAVAARWRELAALLTPDAGLAEVVLLAHGSPADYLRLHVAEAENRGLEDETPDPWFALIDWLIENELAHELDWKENAAELAWGLSRMSAVLSSGVDLQSIDDPDAHLTFGMVRANAILAPAGLELVLFDIDSDSFPVVLVETSKRDRIVALAEELGHRVDVMTLERARHEGGRDYTGEIEL
ncbi:hypothetical protein ASF06_05000 [Agreia sp. Leaf244]|uniref:DUF6630 family protein n=1 Tax=Agreia sp. Leaf244 TaxID=1736305 RepID=UPI0006FAAF94|nr:DUF6630 family protein [Agreia sp. Leaf244]KQO09625.1 hypothetical protein ASF06_05000 [Agreia sp. Leaf244]